MKLAVACVLFCWSVGIFSPSFARPLEAPVESRTHALVSPRDSNSWLDGKASLPSKPPASFMRADTIDFGYVTQIGGALYAVQGETWTFDHGAADPLEGWTAIDLTEDAGGYFRHVSESSWANHGNETPAPLINGAGSMWIGLHQDESNSNCWAGGLGYGNDQCRRFIGPPLTYLGSGSVHIALEYFNDTEPDFDFVRVKLLLQSGAEVGLNGAGFTGTIGSAESPAPFTAEILAPAFQGDTVFRPLIEFTSDASWSDEDGLFDSSRGPFGVGAVQVTGSIEGGSRTFSFGDGPGEWASGACGSTGGFFARHDLSEYALQDACDCNLSGGVLAFHDAASGHPAGQHVQAASPPADKSPLGATYNVIMADLDEYADLPIANGVFCRPGWSYWPVVCPTTGGNIWSDRVGRDSFYYTEGNPACYRSRDVATDWGIPGDAAQVRFLYEVYASCDAFGVPPEVCSGATNISPLLDNVRIRVTQSILAPSVQIQPGCVFRDAFPASATLSPTEPGNADVDLDLGGGVLGDSLVVRGPAPTPSTKWEASLHWRIRREGPGQTSIPGYTSWLTQVADGLGIVGVNAAFTSGQMDSVQLGTVVYRDRFCSDFRESDDDFAGEGSEQNEMLRDGVLAPGTAIDYFISSRYVTSELRRFLPDTTGGNFLEFEILPSYRDVGGTPMLPSILLVDLSAPGESQVVERALNVVLHGAAPGDPLPDVRDWDRVDRGNASVSWSAPLFRAPGGTNGAMVAHLLGYRAILFTSGSAGDGDSPLLRDAADASNWLTDASCQGNSRRQGLLVYGDHAPSSILSVAPSFASTMLGLSSSCVSYHEPACGPNPADENDCVSLVAAPGAGDAPLVPIDLDASGNSCPAPAGFDVLTPTANGVGYIRYSIRDTAPPVTTDFAQMAHAIDDVSQGNFRTITSGVGLNHLLPTAGNCTATEADRASAVASRLQADLAWIFPSPTLDPALDPCSLMKLSRAQAEQLIVDQIILGSPTETRTVGFLFDPAGPDSTLFPGSTVAPFDSTFVHTITSESYFAFLDRDYGNEWFHPAEYVFVDAWTGAITVQSARSWPVVNGTQALDMLRQDGSAPSAFFGSYAANSGTTVEYEVVNTPNTTDWCVIVVGANATGEGERKARENDVARIKEMMNGVDGGPKIDDGNIIVVSGDNYKGGKKDDVIAVLDSLKTLACDNLYFWYIGHGYNGGSCPAGANGTSTVKFPYSELAELLAALPAKTIHVTIEACHSGSAIKEMEKAEAPDGEGGKRKINGTVVTSSPPTTTTTREDFDGAPFIRGLNTCSKDPEADQDEDGVTTILEALVWAVAEEPTVANDRPQAKVLGDSRNSGVSTSVVSRFSNNYQGSNLNWEVVEVTCQLGGAEPVKIRRLYVTNPNTHARKAVRKVKVYCVKDGTSEEIADEELNMEGSERRCVVVVPNDCDRIETAKGEIVPRVREDDPPSFARAEEGQRGVSLLTETRAYSRGAHVYFDRVVRADPGSQFTTDADGIIDWEPMSSPPNFTFPADPDSEVVFLRADIPPDASAGADLVSTIVNHSEPDTSTLTLRALVSEIVGAPLAPGEQEDHMYLNFFDPGAQPFDGPLFTRTTIRSEVPVVYRVAEGDSMTATETSYEPGDSGAYGIRCEGRLAWDHSTLVAPDSVVLAAASGRMNGAEIWQSRGDGLTLTGDLVSLALRFITVEGGTGHGIVTHSASGVLLESCAVSNAAGSDLLLRGNSDAEFRDGSINPLDIEVESGSHLIRSWSTSFIFEDSAGMPASGVSYTIRDAAGAVVATAASDSGGWTAPLALTEFEREGSLEFHKTPHLVEVTYAGWDSTWSYSADALRRVRVTVGGTSTGAGDHMPVPAELSLAFRGSNPLTSPGSLRFGLPTATDARLSVYDASGRELRRLADGRHDAGWHETPLTRDGFAGGVYFCRLSTAYGVRSVKLVLFE